MNEQEKTYQRRYYEENKEEIQRRRRERYKNDPKYRKRIKDLSRKSKQKRKKGLSNRVLGAAQAEDHRRPKVTIVDGREVLVYSRGYLADELAFTRPTIATWQRRGVLPEPTMIDERGQWWFSEAWIKKFITLVKRYRPISWSLDDFAEKVKEHWS